MSYSPFADDFLDMYPSVITLTPYTVTGTGAHIRGTARQYHAYVVADSKAIYTATGQMVFSTSVVIMHPKSLDNVVLVSATPDAELTLPDGTKPKILSIGGLDDESGTVAYEIRT